MAHCFRVLIVSRTPALDSCVTQIPSCRLWVSWNIRFLEVSMRLFDHLRPSHNSKGHATRNDIVDDIVDFSSSTMAFNVAKIASARASLTISLTKSLRVAGPLLFATRLPVVSTLDD